MKGEIDLLMKRMIVFVVCLILICCVFSPRVVIAEEVGAFEANTRPIRWAWTYINANGDVRKCRLKLNADNLTATVWSNVYSSSVNHWNTLDQQFSYSQDKVYAYNVSFQNSKCDLYTASSTHFIYTNNEYILADAVTNYKNASGQWFKDPITGEDGDFWSGTATYSRIYFKTPNESYSLYRRMFVMRHEIGHVLGMGHVATNDNKISLMHPIWNPDISYYSTYYVTSYDIGVLEQFYPNP